MFRKLLFFFALAAIPASVAAQSPFEEIHGDILGKLERMKARRASLPNPLLAPQPTPNQLLFDVLHYTIDVAIEPATRIIEGSVTMRITPVSGILGAVEIDADDVLTISGVRRAVGDTLSWARSAGLVTVDLPPAVSVGDTIDIEILYSGTPALSADPGLFFTSAAGYPLIYSLSEPWSARAWWPCKDYPDDKATFDLYLSVPTPLMAASNGTYLGYEDETRWSSPYRRYHWREDYPMSTYLASITASYYVRIDDYFVYAPGDTMPVTHYVYPVLEAKARTDFDITVPALTFFSETFGLYPFINEKYGVALCSIGGGMEHQTLTSYGSSLVRGDHYYDWIFVHEMSHMWFGDMITCRSWVHIWLNEGFASYSEALWFEYLQGSDKLRSYMESKDVPSRWNGPVLRDPDNMSPDYYFDNVVYNKAAWVLHMLRHVVGDGAFFQILKDYCADPRYRFSTAETNDFKAICEAEYGSPLSWFFDEWLTRTDRLDYRWSAHSYRLNDAFNLTIVVDQAQVEPYAMPVDFTVTTAGGALDTVLWVDEAHEEFHITLADSALDVALDPDHWILCSKTELAPADAVVPSAVSLDQNYPNPFNPRTVIRFRIDEPSRVLLQIFDARGTLVITLVDRAQTVGSHEIAWNGTNERGEALPSGIYFCRLKTDTREISRKMVLVR
jgi:aminopeptidase N